MKELSTHAAAAKMIRKELKKNGIKAKVRSDSYSGGSSIHVTVYNQLPAVVEKIESFCNSFQMGHFNGMEDIYEYSNNNDNLPQVKFVFVRNEISDEIKQAAWDWMKGYYADMEEAPESFTEAGRYPVMGTMGDMFLYRILSESNDSFWTTQKPRTIA